MKNNSLLITLILILQVLIFNNAFALKNIKQSETSEDRSKLKVKQKNSIAKYEKIKNIKNICKIVKQNMDKELKTVLGICAAGFLLMLIGTIISRIGIYFILGVNVLGIIGFLLLLVGLVLLMIYLFNKL